MKKYIDLQKLYSNGGKHKKINIHEILKKRIADIPIVKEIVNEAIETYLSD